MGARRQRKVRRVDLARVSVAVCAVGTTAMLSTRSMISLPRRSWTHLDSSVTDAFDSSRK
jgi:hypothetical protein